MTGVGIGLGISHQAAGASGEAGPLPPSGSLFDRADTWHVVLAMGQSNMVGWDQTEGPDATLDAGDARILNSFYDTYYLSAEHNAIAEAAHPLSAQADAPPKAVVQVSPALEYARRLLASQPANHGVIIVVTAEGGTGFVNADWRVGDQLADESIARANLVIGAITAAGRSVASIAALWQQGEADAVDGLQQGEYAACLDALIGAWRSGITGAAMMPVTLGEMAASYQASQPLAAPIVAALADTPNRLDHTAFVPSVWPAGSGQTGDLPGALHFTRDASRALGWAHFLKREEARDHTVGAPVAPSVSLAPRISGAFVEGEALSVSNGSWSGTAPISYAYRWTRDGADISGATGAGYAITAADVGAVVDCVVTATNAAGSASASASGEDVVAAAGGGGAGLPGGIEDIAAWYDARDGDARTVDGSNLVTEWRDKSGSDFHVSPVGIGNDPSLGTLNGHDAIVCQSDSFGETGSLHTAFAGPAWTVAYYASMTNVNRAMLGLANAADNWCQLAYSAGQYRYATSGLGTAGSLGAATFATPVSIVWIYTGTELQVYEDGSLVGTKVVDLTGAGFDRAWLLCGYDNNVRLDGTVGEVVVLDRAATPSEIAALHGYFVARWA